jgi:hypothetical protein
MLGVLPPEPAAVYDRPLKDKGAAHFEIDISQAQKLWLLVADQGSYSPEKVEAIWASAELVGPDKVVPLSSLKPLDGSGLRASNSPGVGVKTPSRLVYDISGQGYTKLRGSVAIENTEVSSDINPDIRFFVFETEPNMERLTPVLPELPAAAQKPYKEPGKTVDALFWYALGRPPSPAEKQTAEEVIRDVDRKKRVSPDGLADLLWAVMMKPEFQLIY